ncbi:hypothetical protein [Bacillus phage PK1]|nr:hypothetical protein [Bacillus phage PK1]
MYQFFKNDGNRELLTISNKVLQKEVSGSITSIGNLTSDKVKMITYKNRTIKDVVLIADGGKLKAYDGTTVSPVVSHVPVENELNVPGMNDLDNLTTFRTFTIKKDRIYAAAHPTIKNRVSFSYFDPYLGQGVYDYFPATYFFDVASEDNDEIVELKVFRDVLVIFCKRSVWALYGDGSDLGGLELVKINVPKGCISPGSVQEVGNNLFYLSDEHVYSLFSTERNFVSAQQVSENVYAVLKNISNAEKEKAVAAFHDDKYHLSFPSGLTLVYDTLLKAWTKYTNIQANDFMVMDNKLYFSANDGFIYRFNENKFTDDGTPIPFMVKTKIIDFNSPIHRKKIKRMWVIQKQFAGFNSSYDLFGMVDQYELVDLKVLQVNSGAGATWDESIWDDALWDFSEVTQDEIKLRKKSKSIQFQISNKKAGEPITLYGLSLEYQVKKP